MTEWSAIDDRRTLPGELARLERALLDRFCPPLRPEEVERCLLECLAAFEQAPVQAFVPILVERAATERLRRIVGARGERGSWSRSGRASDRP